VPATLVPSDFFSTIASFSEETRTGSLHSVSTATFGSTSTAESAGEMPTSVGPVESIWHASPVPFVSVSVWSGLNTNGQLSHAAPQPSPSASTCSPSKSSGHRSQASPVESPSVSTGRKADSKSEPPAPRLNSAVSPLGLTSNDPTSLMSGIGPFSRVTVTGSGGKAVA
jgi:hypothetical protein